ncbi:MAG: glycosyltransferase family 2 protein [Deltaproteobacteria bacterium]|nr:glycosyltransferase family 2 protein [Deltaproteobacteria bacterium]MBW2417268.1 glycosyltransferase family 2 protein [Deltaproteobacteria bacterium]
MSEASLLTSAPVGACPGLSVCVLACDEEAELARCLDALAWADEIVVVVDAKSRDGSEKVARERAARVEVRTYAGDIEQKRGCSELARNDWVLIVDPDEVVSEALGREIRGLLDGAGGQRGQGGPDGYEVNRATFHLGRWIRHGDFYPDWKLRLYRRSRARWVGRDPHGRVVVEGAVGRLREELAHYSYRDLADQIARIQFFSDQSARAMHRDGRRARVSDLVLRPPARFLRAYLLKRGFLDGTAGFIIAAATAFHVFLKYAKLWERERGAGGTRG